MKFYSSFLITPQNCLTNRAISYGDGVFETMLMCNGTIALWKFHWQRLLSSLSQLNINPLDENSITNQIKSLVADDGKYIVKLVVFRNDSKRGYGSKSNQSHYFITINPYTKMIVSDKLTVSSITLSSQTILSGIKHLNRLEQVLAAQELNDSLYNDALMCDQKGHIIETISKNIILIKDKQIYTPNLDESGVYGVALRWLQSKQQELDFQINWKKIELNDLPQYHDMMVCNSIHGFTSIKSIDDKVKFEQQSNLANKIKSHFKEYIN